MGVRWQVEMRLTGYLLIKLLMLEEKKVAI
jgi:hypothetical protein